MNATVKNNSTKVATVKATTKKATTKAVTEKAILKAVTKKAESNGLYRAALECNKLDKIENFSLSGAKRRLEKQIYLNPVYMAIDSNLLSEALTFDNLLSNVSARCIEKQRFTVHSLGMAVNKYLKPLLKK
jgi:adenine-specific DNA methylase